MWGSEWTTETLEEFEDAMRGADERPGTDEGPVRIIDGGELDMDALAALFA